MKRREFVKWSTAVAGAALGAPLLGACSRMALESQAGPAGSMPGTGIPPSPTTTPSPTVMSTATSTPEPSMVGRVALVKTEDRSTGIEQAINLLEYNPLRGKQLFLKPNFNSADTYPGSTHIETLRQLVLALRQMGSDAITIGDRSGMGDTRAVMRTKGVENLAAELNIELLVFDQLGSDEWVLFQPEGSHWQGGYAFAGPMLAADGIVQTCCLKTHRYGGHFTLSLKNSVGMVAKTVPGNQHNFMNELHSSAAQRLMIAEINQAYQPDLVVLDGMEAFVDGGPDYGTRVAPGVILAGTDRIAIDAVGVAILRYFGTTAEVRRGSIFDQEQIARAVELGLGVQDAQGIEIITSDDASREFARALQGLLLQG
ncbi:MAG: DUF362 domain-containing protein [Anaerolineales bacterium]|jgi:uncharacterized protein (DUF362 family)